MTENPQIQKIEKKDQIVMEEKIIKKQEVLENVSLKQYNTFGVDAFAKYFAEIKDEEELLWLLNNPKYKELQKLILGGGSNILFVKDYFEGLVLRISLSNIQKIKENANFVYIKAGSGVIWHDLVEYCVRNNYHRIENLSLIPGTVGAAPIQNIGAYGTEVAQIFDSLEAINLETNEIETFKSKSCKFCYRESIFKNENKGKYIILNVTFRLSKKPKFNLKYSGIKEELTKKGITKEKLTLRNVSDAIIKVRTEKLPDPKILGNAGSFFKNPKLKLEDYEKIKKRFPDMPSYKDKNKTVKVSAAWLIQQAGWKGKTIGDVGTYPKQPLVIVNYGDATGEEIYNFAKKIRLAVKAKFGIELEYEVNIID